ncbi:MAG: diacylglycerol kinase family protein [Anaerolineales bacterium]|jgi:diacylglycerol kinase
MQPIKSPNLISSFRNAFSGLWYALRTQRNAQFHLLATLLVILVGFWVGLDTVHWCLIILAMGLVWMAELSNTALESVVDLANPTYHPLAKTAKDVKAAVVIIAALAAILVGVLILGPALAIKLGWSSP